jgi:hypothetical protein
MEKGRKTEREIERERGGGCVRQRGNKCAKSKN